MEYYLLSTLLSLLLIGTTLINPVASVTWRASPVDTKVRHGRDATLRCEINEMTGNTVIWQKDDQVLFVNTIRHKAPARMSVVTGSGDGQFNLAVRGAVEADDGVYKCSVGQSVLSKSAHLQVIVAPRSAQLTLDKRGDLWAGQKVTFNCSTRGGNPPPQVRWYRGDAPLSVAHVSNPPKQKFGTASDVMTWTLTKEDHNQTFTCTAENDANVGEPIKASLSIDVQYAPTVTLTPGGTVLVLAGDSLNLTCGVEANPAVTSVKWYRGGTLQTETGLSYGISQARIGEDDTVFECVAENKRGEGRQTAVVRVIYAPKVNVPQAENGLYYINESGAVNISCVVDAYPPADTVFWRKLDSPGTIVGRSLIMYNLHKDHSGMYECQASNLLQPTGKAFQKGTGKAAVQIVVQHKPGLTRIEQIPKGRISTGQEVTLRCSAISPGFPEGSIHWTKEGDSKFTFVGSELRLNEVQLQDNGIYTCSARNILGTGPSSKIQLVVNEEASILAPTIQTTKFVKMSDVNVIITCQVRGKPAPQVTWYKDGSAISRSSGFYSITVMEESVDIYSRVVSSQLQLTGKDRQPNYESIRIEDSGNYTCLVSNGIGDDKSQKINLLVQYKPVVTAVTEKLAVDINSTATLSCHARALPAPRFEWYRGNQHITGDARTSLVSATPQPGGADVYEGRLSLRDVAASDLGKYRCVARNEIGNGMAQIQLTVKTVPDAPWNLSVGGVTWESVMLSWQPGFDGGYRQAFTVIYTSPGQPTGRAKVKPYYVNFYNVTGLSPGRRYTFMVYGQNQLGMGAYSASTTTATHDYEVMPPLEVHHDLNTNLVTFTPSSGRFCARIELLMETGSWQVYQPCAPSTGGSVKLDWQRNVQQINVSFCLQRWTQICSQPITAKSALFSAVPSEDVLHLTTAIILGSVCGTTLVLALLILSILCLRRRRRRIKENEQKDIKKPRTLALTTVSEGNYSGPSEIRVFDADHSPSYNSETSQMLNSDYRHITFGIAPDRQSSNMHNTSFQLKAPPSGHVYNNFPQSTLYMTDSPYITDIEKPLNVDLNSSGETLPSTSDIPKSTLAKLDTHSNNGSEESGYSTPTKSKRVIHEVVV